LQALGKNIAIQGEILGEGIQKNKYNIKGQKLYVFTIYDINQHRSLGFEEMKGITEHLGLETVPILSTAFSLPPTMEALIEYSNGESRLFKVVREGVVIRAMDGRYDEEIRGRLSFKVINPQFLLKYEE
jgi:ATP-dependent RNA circularization protein (DNA/RNA ligase family)